ncbi:hypothetical protein Pla123a_08360 [Posidoniimonas polymericola]|uniref:DUF1559 domain-containing protein n=1 Tax=Posidoniimonas polymericola TaxID=2528002 RepID=A0A5C5YTQ3_9BACT|nr:DUF1559 domain-containing protein [Posidoniimonas polymericola]TWT78047.1 hypothetical protein Pla123a_08360 [Posidoniimonas polymericola]
MPRFSITALLWLFALVAAGMTTFGPVLGAICSAVVLIQAVNLKNKKVHLGWKVLAMLSPLWVGPFFTGVFDRNLQVDHRTCEQRVGTIVNAMLSYADDHGALPPPVVRNADGDALHSWRVLLLPYLGEQELYDAYDFSQPWDSPHNLALAERIPDVYRCPGNEALDHLPTTYLGAPGMLASNYFVVVGPHTAFPEGDGRPLSELTDGLAATALVVETADRNRCWLDPDYLTVSEAVRLLTTPTEFRHLHVREHSWSTTFETWGGEVGFADGHTADVRAEPNGVYARAILTADQDDDRRVRYRRGWDMNHRERLIRWDRVLGFCLFATVSLLPELKSTEKQSADGTE